MFTKALRSYWPLAPALAVYGFLAHRFDYIQDDAYISYRFVANFLNGHGLVYNIGERVEGFTNFGWVIYLALWGNLGDIYMTASRVTGLLFGAGIIVVTYLIARLIFAERDRWFALVPLALIAFNQSLACWAPAGLETAAFGFMAIWSLYLYLRRSPLLIWSILLAVWLRPEGAFVAGLLIALELIAVRRIPKYTLRCVGLAFVLSLPFVAFKLAYYGSILPNPFYAKTGLSSELLVSGLEYAERFWTHYGFYGLGMILTAVMWKRMFGAARDVWLFTVAYMLYIILVGGDVLKIHRFFIPIMGTVAAMTGLAVFFLFGRLPRALRYFSLGMAVVLLTFLTYQLPHAFVSRYEYYEKAFLRKMTYLAEHMLETDSTNFAVATPTIGVFGYELLGHDIIDMVGLTDSTIARHSEEPIPGMETTWKERRHNSRYLLTRAPEYIVFSTGIKPSAPAERALCLFPAFLRAYRQTGWYYRPVEGRDEGSLVSAFKRVRDITGELEPTLPVAYVQYYQQGIDAMMGEGDYPRAVMLFHRALEQQPRPENPDLLYHIGFACLNMKRHREAIAWYDSTIAMDSMMFQAQKDAYMYAVLTGDTAKAAIHARWVQKLTPWYWPKVERDVAQMREEAEQAQKRRQGN